MRKVLALMGLLLLLSGCGDGKMAEVPAAESVPKPQVETVPEPEPEPIRATLAVCGDVMSHMPVTRDAWDAAAERYDYTPILAGAAPYVAEADYAVANLETTLAEGDYSGFPHFRSPDGLAESLKEIGFDLLLTANNHCYDSGFSGACRTLDVLDQLGLAHVGTSRTEEEAENHIVVADVGGISVAFLGYTYSTNGIPLSKDAPWSVNLFNTDYMTTVSTLDEVRLERDLAQAESLGTDLTAVMIHWGVEYQTHQNAYQERVADFLIAHGADLVLGGHSHVPQPAEMREVETESGETRQGLVLYSLGNFLSSQKDPYTDVTAVVEILLEKDSDGAAVADWSYVPLWRQRKSQSPGKFRLLDVHQALAEGVGDREKLGYALSACHEILGEERDRRPAPAEK